MRWLVMQLNFVNLSENEKLGWINFIEFVRKFDFHVQF